MTKSPRKNLPDVGIELGAACMPSGHASDRATAPGINVSVIKHLSLECCYFYIFWSFGTVRFNKTESAIFKLWMLYFRGSFFILFTCICIVYCCRTCIKFQQYKTRTGRAIRYFGVLDCTALKISTFHYTFQRHKIRLVVCER